jgi:hypothetical protein
MATRSARPVPAKFVLILLFAASGVVVQQHFGVPVPH